ncbi:MAG: RNA polymerase sigma factor [Candidatus Aminicenantaceae bacterium]
MVKKNETRVAATVIGMLGHCTEAEDIGQETFIRFYKSMNKFRGESSISTYLTRIAINLSLNEIKRRQRRRKYLSTASEDGLDNIPEITTSKNKKETQEIVNLAIQKLKPKFRSVLVLRLILGYTTQETAKLMKLPVGTVLSRLTRAQMKLKDILTPSYEGLK